MNVFILRKLFNCLFLFTFFFISSFSRTPEEIFTDIYLRHLWGGGKETVSGSGSTLRSTRSIVKQIPFIIKKFNIKSILDVPCGDFNWMRKVDLSGVKYLGADIVFPMINKNNKIYGKKDRTFFRSKRIIK